MESNYQNSPDKRHYKHTDKIVKNIDIQDISKESSELQKSINNTLKNKISDRNSNIIPDFPIEIFPTQIQELIQDGEKKLCYPPEYFATGILSAVATAIGKGASLNNGSYKVHPILWAAIVGDTGTNKTYSLKCPFDPLKESDDRSYEIYKEALENYKINSSKENQKPNKKPVFRKYLYQDFTIEAISKACEHNEKGISLYNDELIGWINGFDRYKGKGSEQQRYLELFNGGAIKVDRKGDDPIYIKDTCINVIGGMQTELLTEFTKGKRMVDGFLYRFLFSFYTGKTERRFTGKSIDNLHLRNYSNMINLLIELENEQLKVSPEGIDIYKEWQKNSYNQNKSDEVEAGIQSKLEIYVWRLSLIIDLMDQKCNNLNRDTVSPKSIKHAITLVEYFRNNALLVHDKIGGENPFSGVKPRLIDCFRELPEKFKRKNVEIIFEKHNIRGGTISRFLKNERFFTKEKEAGVYRKKSFE